MNTIYMSTEVWDEINLPFSNFNICTVDVWDMDK